MSWAGIPYQPAPRPVGPYVWSGIPDIMGALRGVRVWRWMTDTNVLWSAAKDVQWPADGTALEAVCLNDQVQWKTQYGLFVRTAHEAVPQPSCTCGIWGLYDYYQNMVWKPGVTAPAPARSVVVAGVIEATGRIVEGSIGFRAQRAKIVSLCFEGLDRSQKRAFKRLAAKYQLPIADTLPTFEKPSE